MTYFVMLLIALFDLVELVCLLNPFLLIQERRKQTLTGKEVLEHERHRLCNNSRRALKS